MKEKMMKIKTISEDNSGVFEGYLSTYGNADREGDVIEAGSFDKSVKKKSVIPMLFNHDRNKVIGKLELSSDNHGLLVKGTLNLNDPEAKNIDSLLKMGALDSLSVGMGVKKYEVVDPKRPYDAWKIKEADVYEGSVVTIPANERAKINTVKGLTEKERTELEALRVEKKLSKVTEILKNVEEKLNET